MAARKKTTTKKQTTSARTKRLASAAVEETKAKTSKTTATSSSFLSRLWTNQTQLSFVLGAIVVVVLAALLFRYFERPNTDVTNPNEQANVLSTATPGTDTSPMATTMQVEMTTQPTARPQASTTPQPTQAPTQMGQAVSGQAYAVKAGDTLWSIAESQLRDGYKWSEIAKLNNLTNPDILTEGMRLNLPKTDQTAMAPTETKGGQVSGQATQVYKVVVGETLWSISQKVYGDPYMWSKIAQANNLTNPSVIHSENVLTIPPK